MENGGGAKPTTRFAFSWADEVEREEREREQEQAAMQQQQQPPPPREATKREQIKPDPFGAARPREVVLAEKGVDWRARDRELDLGPAPRPPRSAARGHGERDRDAGRTPHPRRQAAAAAPSTPRPPPPTGRRDTPSVGRSARGGSKRKFAGEGPARRACPVGGRAEQGRRVFGELNVGNGCGPSFCDSAAGNVCEGNPGGCQTKGMKAAGAVAADGALSTAVTAAESAESAAAAGQKRRRGRKRGKIGQGQEAGDSAGLGTPAALITE